MKISKAFEKAVNLAGTKKELARLAGVKPQTLHQWINGTRPVPPARAILIEKGLDSKVKKEWLCPDFPWSEI